ncbi:sensor histidine kinase [Nonomuraea sp. SBT364]|uniref:sensor histidine kinase n=1 Tax=Nonomuraea sp. SBT364 TaxID=1580530 RepID=UPI00066D3C29|nr:ATP-binding protein [Nonomuraea sp. SBT364]
MRPATWTLRARLVMAVLGLTTVALVLANVFGITLLHDTMVDRVDKELTGLSKISTERFLPMGVAAKSDVLTKRFASELRIALYTADGRIIRQSPDAGSPGPVIETLELGAPYTVPGTSGASWRVLASPASDGTVWVVAQSLTEAEQVRTSNIAIATAVSALVLLLLGLAGDALVRLGLRPLTRMERTAGHITRGDFASRVPAPDPHTEAGRLGAAMNVMLDRVESEIAARTASEARMRRFLADASHELRTPLTSVRGFAELYRRGGGDTGEMMGRIEDEAARMSVLVNDLLTLAQLDEERPLDRRPVDLLAVAADSIRDARARVPDRQVRLAGLGGTLAPVFAVGDEARLRQVAANLIGNALTHTPPGAAVTVRVGSRAGQAVLEVADTGPGIAPEHVPQLFDRLYRISQGRSRADGGNGLGLAIVAAIVRAHGGRVDVDTAPGRGATFSVLLPVSQAAPSPL